MPRALDASPNQRELSSLAFFAPTVAPDEIAALPADLRMRYAAWLRVSGQHDAAAAVLHQFEELSGETATLLDERAALALAAGDGPAVRALHERRLADRPAPTARVAYARALIELGSLEEAAAIISELVVAHWDLATVRSAAADLALLQGDLGAAHDAWSSELMQDETRIAPRLALVRIALLSGDFDEARSSFDRVLVDADSFTAAQTAAAAGLAELLGQPSRARAMRIRFARQEAERAAALAAEIDTALARDPGATSNGRGAQASPPLAAPSLPDALAPVNQPDLPAELPIELGITDDEPIADDRVLTLLHEVFGHESLRPGQSAVINRILAGQDTLAILPTGAGKTLTFQLASLLLPGTTLVLSPLIALMKDQAEAMSPALRERTVLINSTLSQAEQQRAMESIAAGTAKLVYAAPERLRQHAFIRALREANISLVVVDEAHCISLWGHDFRPDYLTIPATLPEMGDPALLAVTATATSRIEAGIAAAFGRRFDRVRASVFRLNLHYEVHRLPNREDKIKKVIAVCREEQGPGIVYVSSRKDAEAIAALLRDRGVGAIPYHAGLDPQTRADNQERFMGGQVPVVVATVAFGMGVDKRDVRFIVHLNPPQSLEAYSQESGRAGRDGLPARCVLLVAPSDQATLNRLARRDEQDIDTLRRLYMAVKHAARGRWAIVEPNALLPPPDFDEDVDDRPDPRIGLGLLDQARLLRRCSDAPVTYTLRRSGADDSLGETDAPFAELALWSGLDARGAATFRTAEACERLDISPIDLGRLLSNQPDLSLEEGPRLVCLEMLPAGTDAGARLNGILARSRREAKARIQHVITYAHGTHCRHTVLANHLGEQLDPCGDACDICLGASAPAQRGQSAPADGATGASTRLTAADALAVLDAVRTLPFGMGKTGLARLLLGSVESRVRADRSPHFGALSNFKKGKVEALIDRLAADGFLFRDLDHEYKLIHLTERGAAATLDDLSAYDESVRRPRSSSSNPPNSDDLQLAPEDEALLQQLQDWRRDRASRDAVPPYVVAHNATLAELVLHRPDSVEALTQIKGFGPARTEKYGHDVLSVLTDNAAPHDPD